MLLQNDPFELIVVLCASVGFDSVQLYVAPFDATNPNQQWKYSPDSRQITNSATNRCIAVSAYAIIDNSMMVTFHLNTGFTWAIV